MQEIKIYAAANETLAVVRDFANARTVSAPSLVIGVSAKLVLTLFAESNSTKPLDRSMFDGITAWQFVMDDDYDVSTTPKIVADNENITLNLVPPGAMPEDTPTVFTIPLIDMNSSALRNWLGTNRLRSGMTGELVGYIEGESVFVLQIENFTIRNRIVTSIN